MRHSSGFAAGLPCRRSRHDLRGRRPDGEQSV